MNLATLILNKLDKNDYTIFYTPECPYSMRALELLRLSGVPYKAYNIFNKPIGSLNNINLAIQKLHEMQTINNVNIEYFNAPTRPLIFYKHDYIGGYTDLNLYIN